MGLDPSLSALQQWVPLLPMRLQQWRRAPPMSSDTTASGAARDGFELTSQAIRDGCSSPRDGNDCCIAGGDAHRRQPWQTT